MVIELDFGVVFVPIYQMGQSFQSLLKFNS